MERREKHIVVFPFPAQGHINPALHLCRNLAGYGFYLTFVSTHFNIAILKSQRALDQTLGSSIRLIGLSDGLPEGHGGTDDLPRLAAATENMEGLLETFLREQLLLPNPNPNVGSEEKWAPPVCIVTDTFLGWVHGVARKLNMLSFVLFTPHISVLIFSLNLSDMAAFPVSEGSLDTPVGIQGLTPTTLWRDIPSHLLLPPSEFMHGFFLRQVSKLKYATGFLCNSFYHLDRLGFDAVVDIPYFQNRNGPRFLSIGPLLPNSFFADGENELCEKEEDREPCLKWLDSQRTSSVLYVSFGSIAVLSLEQSVELAKGLEASGYPFLWVSPKASSAQKEGFPPGFQKQIEGRGCLASWVPQKDVLRHPAIAAFLSHCGWNSTLEAISTGIPLLAWPLFAEQRMICRFVVDELKIAMAVHRDAKGFASALEIEDAVCRMLEGEEFHAMKKRSYNLQKAAKESMSPTGSSTKNLQLFVQEMTAVHSLKFNS